MKLSIPVAVQLLNRLKRNYPRDYFNMTDELISKRAEDWQHFFKDYSEYCIKKAVNELIETSRYAPTTADIKAKCREIKAKAMTQLDVHKQATEGLLVGRFNLLSGQYETERIKQGTPLDENVMKEVYKIIYGIEQVKEIK